MVLVIDMHKKSAIKNVNDEFELFYNNLSDIEKEEATYFFNDLKNHIALSLKHNLMIKEDFEKAILYLCSNNVSFKDALKRLDLANLGGFYCRPSSLWLEMDDVAKMYSLFMGRDSMGVFRLSFYLKNDIVPEILQIALLYTVKRFPSFAVSVKKGFFWPYLDSLKRRFKIEKETGIPCQPINISYAGSQTFRVLYYNNRISVEFFHGLTDGTGGLNFIKSLVREYLTLLGRDIPNSDNVFNVNEIAEISEYENSFRSLKLNGKKDALLQKQALQLGGKLSRIKPSRIIHFKMDTDKLKEVTKKYNATVSSYIISILMMASKASIDDIKGDISVCFPINLRNHFESKTVRNFSVFSSIRTGIEKVTSVSDLIPLVSDEIKRQTTNEALINTLSSTVGITQKIGIIPLFLKQPIVKIGYSFLGDNQFTTTLSNLGLIKLPEEMASEVISCDFILGTAITNRAVTSLISVNNVSTLSISKLTKDPSFEEGIYKLLSSDGLDIIVEGSEEYEN